MIITQRDLRKISILILFATFLAFSRAFAETAKKAIQDGFGYVMLGNYDGAIVSFTKAIELDSNSVEAYSNRGAAYIDKGSFDAAILDFNKAIKLDPNLAEAYYNRAIAYFYKRDYNKAWSDVHKAEKLEYEVNPKFLEKLKEASGRKK